MFEYTDETTQLENLPPRSDLQKRAKELGINSTLKSQQLHLIIKAVEGDRIGEIPRACAIRGGLLSKKIEEFMTDNPECADRPTLQKMAKTHGIRANLKMEELVNLILEVRRGNDIPADKKARPKKGGAEKPAETSAGTLADSPAEASAVSPAGTSAAVKRVPKPTKKRTPKGAKKSASGSSSSESLDTSLDDTSQGKTLDYLTNKQHALAEKIAGRYGDDIELMKIGAEPRSTLQKMAGQIGIRANQTNLDMSSQIIYVLAELKGYEPGPLGGQPPAMRGS